jgi:5'-nucleotidase/UDP-sugar diphosphatase
MVIKEIGGVRVGLVGITIAGKTRASSRPLASTQFLDETASRRRPPSTPSPRRACATSC